jgi:hypothetical protein
MTHSTRVADLMNELILVLADAHELGPGRLPDGDLLATRSGGAVPAGASTEPGAEGTAPACRWRVPSELAPGLRLRDLRARVTFPPRTGRGGLVCRQRPSRSPLSSTGTNG